MPHPTTGQSWIELDHDLSSETWHSLAELRLVCVAPPFEERTYDEDPMDDLVVLFGCVMRRRLALSFAMQIEDPDLVAGVLADTQVVDPDTSPDTRRTLFDELETVIPPEILTAVLLERDELERIEMEDKDQYLDYAA